MKDPLNFSKTSMDRRKFVNGLAAAGGKHWRGTVGPKLIGSRKATKNAAAV